MVFNTSYLIIPFKEGSNASDTIISGVHFNLTTLQFWNYTLYANSTLSNGSNCFVTLPEYIPAYIFPNGSFTNSSSCYRAYHNIGTRGGVGMAFVGLFSIVLILCIVNLARLGKQYLPAQKMFVPVGRRWQWYWSLWTCAFALTSLITNIDVDRYYVMEIPIILNVFFWYLMQMGAIASVWEAVRHWGSWMERQFIDPDPTRLRLDDRRSRAEFRLPLVFYMWWWLQFFMVIPRAWTRLEYQRYPGQAEMEAALLATDNRFKAGGFIYLAAFMTIIFSLGHSVWHYEMNHPEEAVKHQSIVKMIPLRFKLTLPVLMGLIVYQIICSFDFSSSPAKVGTNLIAMYVGGYLPSLVVIILHNVFGLLSENEDKVLIRQRRERDIAIDQEQGRVPKPRWWDLVKFGNLAGLSVEERLTRQTEEIQPTRRVHEVEVPPSMSTNTISNASVAAYELPPPYTEVESKGTQDDQIVNQGHRRDHFHITTAVDQHSV